MRSSGVCPKCHSHDVYTNRELPRRGERSVMPLGNWNGLYIDVYLCTTCGYMEEYISAQDMEKPATMDKLRSTWKKM